MTVPNSLVVICPINLLISKRSLQLSFQPLEKKHLLLPYASKRISFQGMYRTNLTEGLTITIFVLQIGVISCVVSTCLAADAIRHAIVWGQLTKREKASLNSETCSSVNESACDSIKSALCSLFLNQFEPPRLIAGSPFFL